MMPNILLLPTLSCPGSCVYCFGPRQPSPTMSPATTSATARWVAHLAEDSDWPAARPRAVNIIFHGGEPLVAGAAYYREALPLFRSQVRSAHVNYSLQSNLWLLDQEFSSLFRDFGVSIGTSLDGPEQIHDSQRGRGSFRRTMAGIELARGFGLRIMCVCTVTRESAKSAAEIFEFFSTHQMEFMFKAAVGGWAGEPCASYSLSAEEHAKLVTLMMVKYLASGGALHVPTIDSIFRSLVTRSGGAYIAGKCLGSQLAVGPDGGIYNCQHFVGMEDYRWASVHTDPDTRALRASPGWQAFQRRFNAVARECEGCSYLDICRGGCIYNALTESRTNGTTSLRDPACAAYRKVLDAALQQIQTAIASRRFEEERNGRCSSLHIIRDAMAGRKRSPRSTCVVPMPSTELQMGRIDEESFFG